MVQTRSRVFSFSHLNVFDGKHPYSDPGNHDPDHFKPHMSKMRFVNRQALLKVIAISHSEDIIQWIQSHLRTRTLDAFFAFTAIMGSHTFYVVMLPIPRWTGFSAATRDLVYILGYSIYLSGHFKDYWCLPRPRSPPVHRITLSDYTTKEYGAPSSHTANATGVSLLVIWYISQLGTEYQGWKPLMYILTTCYFFILTFGRIYCGMHGILDLASGIIIGIVCCALRIYTKVQLDFDRFSVHSGVLFPVFSILFGSLLLKLHARPVDACPSIEDSVAFIGVIIGLECSDWLSTRIYDEELYYMPYDYSKLGAMGTLLRIVVGVIAVLLWKELSRKVIYWLLAKTIGDDRPSKLALELERDTAANTLANASGNSHKREGTLRSENEEVRLFTPLANIDIIGRTIVYAGIPATVILICPVLYQWLGIYK